ncbi:hypothetical protein H4J63_10805 [Pseudoalteromonas sp. 5Ae-yellow]|uniref:hypothetical protein n=1 Tax=Pseudoalteromonas sp. 5Ae-yellow TaxID=2759847 RepID=UPI0015F3C550|nr:hypothetical protein [Pseudoalteromonas sp. 5Ae-yellow]MBA6409802.1 hypothetical protein [Pseudoalteromonas sp. 5Ae-yellow]
MRISFFLTSSFFLFATSFNSIAKNQNDWILNQTTEQDRFAIIQKYLRGFDQPMLEVGQRFEKMHEAVERNNPEFAEYQWRKIKTTIHNGTLKRPARAHNANAILFSGLWKKVQTSLLDGKPSDHKTAFNIAKGACMACHAAEKKAYINNQALFDLTF